MGGGAAVDAGVGGGGGVSSPVQAWLSAPFEPFGGTHLAAACAGGLACLACGGLARRERARGGRAFADGFAGAVLGWNLLAILWWLTPPNFDFGTSLPLHVCDLVNLLLPAALWTRNRLLLAVSVFWGLGLSTQAFFTPTLNEPAGDLRFWLFWAGHTTAAAGCFVIAGGTGFRPGWRDWRRAVLVGVGFVAVLLLFNGAFGTNYGFVGNDKPLNPTLIDRLGPWPWRVGWLVVIGAAAQGVVVLVYPLVEAATAVGARAVALVARAAGRR